MVLWLKILLTMFFVAVSALYYLVIYLKHTERMKLNLVLLTSLLLVIVWTIFEIWLC